MAAGRDRLGVNLVLIEQSEQRGMARRAVLGIADGLAGGVLERLDRRIRHHEPVGVRRADHGAADDPHRRALGKTADGGFDAAAAGDIHAARNHGLMGLRTALGVQDLDREATLGENAGALAEFGDRRIPLPPLRDRDPEGIGGSGRGERRQHGRSDEQRHVTRPHVCSSRVLTAS
jgi:hypothetical protein